MTSAVNILLRSALDRDAREYCAETGAQDKRAISQFFRGLKNEGIWPNSVFWMLRATQNYGTGTAVKSAGGLGRYPGTMVNGPTWGVDGVTIDTLGQRIRTEQTLFYMPMTIGVVGTSGEASFGAAVNTGPVSSALRGAFVGVIGSTNFVYTIRGENIYAGTASSSGAPTPPYHMSGVIDTTSIKLFFGGALTNTGSYSLAPPGGHAGVTVSPNTYWYIGASLNSLTSRLGTTAFAYQITSALTDVEIAAFHAIYKSTIGQGLGLP